MDDLELQLILQNQQLVALGFAPILAPAASRGVVVVHPPPPAVVRPSHAPRTSRSAPIPPSHPAFPLRHGHHIVAPKPYGPFRPAASIRSVPPRSLPLAAPGAPSTFVDASGHLFTTSGHISRPEAPPAKMALHTSSTSWYAHITFDSVEIPARDRALAAPPPPWVPRKIQPVVNWSHRSNLEVVSAHLSGFSVSKREDLGAALKSFHIWCDVEGVPDDLRGPVNTVVLVRYLAALAGRFRGELLKSRVNLLRDWHRMHRIEWEVDEEELVMYYANGYTNAPPPKYKREPLLTDHIVAMLLHPSFDPTDPFDLAWASATTLGHASILRSGEFTCPSKPKWDPSFNVTLGHLSEVVVPSATAPTTKYELHLPWTKTKKSLGETVGVAELGVDHPACPVAWLKRHVAGNKVQLAEGLWSYTSTMPRSKGQRFVLTKAAWIKRTNELLLLCGLPALDGHSVRIGGATQLLMNGVPPEVVKAQGRWASDAFQVYWRYVTVILSEHTSRMVVASAPLRKVLSWSIT
ncbi:hypothetical protein P7C70_g8297, partial [Phenoliferia sp. Uapishka_3]